MTADHIICVLEREGKKLSDTIEKIGYRTGNDLHCKKNRLLIVDDFIPERRDVLAAIRELPTILIGKAVKIVELIGLDEPGKIDRRSTILDDSPWDKRGFNAIRTIHCLKVYMEVSTAFISMDLRRCPKFSTILAGKQK